MRTTAWSIPWLVALLVIGCSDEGPLPSTPESTPSPSAATSPPENAGSLAGEDSGLTPQIQAAVGIYHIELDLDALSATVELKEQPRAAAQSEIYNLEIGSFLRPNSLTIDSVSTTALTVDMTYSLTHPFGQASDLCGAVSNANRADLAVTGRILWLVGGSDGNIYFPGDGDYEANTTLVTNADGYFKPQGMVDSSLLDTNTFPYQEIVDELAGGTGNRQGLSNGGNLHGNYPGTTSWTETEYTAGITGFGVWGQGQTATNTISLSINALTSGETFATDVAVLVKYEDPRGAGIPDERRDNRLPCGLNSSSGLARDLTYRMPHGALDVSVVSEISETGGFLNGLVSNSSVSCKVQDWDAFATEATRTNLGGEPDTSLVSAGESGAPFVDVDIPGITGSEGDPLTVGGPGTGEPGDELNYAGLVDGTPTLGAGVYTGMVRATDIVDLSPPVAWDVNHFNLEAGGTFNALTTNFEGEVLQPFFVTVVRACAPATIRFNADFESPIGDNAWLAGFGGLANGDNCTPSNAFAYCGTPALPVTVGSTGLRWNTGPDSSTCTAFPADYGSNINGHVVSPSINLTGYSCVDLQFDGFRNDAGPTASHTIRYSTDGGGTWNTLFTQPWAVNQADPDTVINADILAGLPAVRLDFWFRDPANYFSAGCWTPTLNPIAGWAFDNVIVRAN